jgi:hypothetical protein
MVDLPDLYFLTDEWDAEMLAVRSDCVCGAGTGLGFARGGQKKKKKKKKKT